MAARAAYGRTASAVVLQMVAGYYEAGGTLEALLMVTPEEQRRQVFDEFTHACEAEAAEAARVAAEQAEAAKAACTERCRVAAPVLGQLPRSGLCTVPPAA